MTSHENAIDTPVRFFFVSYSRQDSEIVTPVVQLLRAADVPLFRDIDGIQPGKKWRLVLERSIERADVLLLFWSDRAAKSTEVDREWRHAANLGKDIIPIILDDTVLPDMLAEYQGIDFRSIIRIGHPWESILQELAELISLRISGVSMEGERGWWDALRERWSKKR